MYLRELFLKEDDRATAVFAFGRFNPPTIDQDRLFISRRVIKVSEGSFLNDQT